jgi:acetolactate synthase-1/2/3 large subunit
MNKPVILLGNGIRGNPDLIEYLSGLGIPILTTWMAADLLPEDNPVFCGRPGLFGQRAANIIQQKATHLYCFGARLDEQQVCYQYDNFAPNAYKYIWDIDQTELDKLPKDWARYRNKFEHGTEPIDDNYSVWLSWCKALYTRFRPELEGVDNPDFVDPFRFVSMLSHYAEPDDIIISGAGKAGEILCQSFKIKAGQRFQTLSTNGAMGYDIPLSIGAALATGRRVLCVTGDGGFQLNAQELEVIHRLRLPIQFFVHSNGGYASIKQMQKARFDGNIVGADKASGFTIPTLASLAECYGLSYTRIDITGQICGTEMTRADDMVRWFVPSNFADAQIIELVIDPDYVHYPRVAISLVDGKWVQDSMEDMTPKIDDLQEIMDA